VKRQFPTHVSTLGDQVASAARATCAVMLSGQIWCWGNWHSFDGNGYTQNMGGFLPSPVRWHVHGEIFTGATDMAVDRQNTETCALRHDGTVYCWGYEGTKGGRPVQVFVDGWPLENVWRIGMGEDLGVILTDGLAYRVSTVTEGQSAYANQETMECGDE
jgi:hypothetical protein